MFLKNNQFTFTYGKRLPATFELHPESNITEFCDLLNNKQLLISSPVKSVKFSFSFSFQCGQSLIKFKID